MQLESSFWSDSCAQYISCQQGRHQSSRVFSDLLQPSQKDEYFIRAFQVFSHVYLQWMGTNQPPVLLYIVMDDLLA